MPASQIACSKCSPARRRSAQDNWLPTRPSPRFHYWSASGPLTTVGGGIRSLNVALRQMLDLYVCLRPVRYFKGVPSPVKSPEKGRRGHLPREHRRHLRGHRNTRAARSRRRRCSTSGRRSSRKTSQDPLGNPEGDPEWQQLLETIGAPKRT